VSEGYFTRATLLPAAKIANWYRQAAWRGELHRDHAAVWRLFPGDGISRDFIFRVGSTRDDGALQYYVVSRRKPVDVSGEIQAEVKPYQPRFNVGEQLTFSLRANPTVSRGESGARSKRHDVLMDAKKGKVGEMAHEAIAKAATGWLVNRGPSIGLAIDPDPKMLRFDSYRQYVSSRRGGAPLRFSSLDFDGMAVVTDVARLTEALFTGVGHSKGFGCGLLLVRRAG
jgi:CRISPR system Cascade subunit CasE